MPVAEAKATRKVARHKKPLVSRRRGRKVEEDDDETVATEESYTDDSGLSEDEASASDEGSEEEDEDEEELEPSPENAKMVNGNGKGKPATTDTEVMRNGMAGKEDAEVVDFEDMGKEEAEPKPDGKTTQVEVRSQPPKPPTPTQESPVQEERKYETYQERKRREVEEYKKRREEDPTFIPNRGKFFMHDHRDAGPGSNGFRPFGRGRGRGTRFGDFPPDPPELADSWKHDMHEQHEVDERERPAPPQHPQNQPTNYSNHSFVAGRQRGPDQPRAFGRTQMLGTVKLQVKLDGMESPITFSEVPLKVYTRLPFHRPPLRRDKPVRVALPSAPVRYIYPSIQRSFIFIPRAMRPGGSGYIRGAGRGRGGYQGGFRPGSMYGGNSTTMYSPSVGMSRRSSMQFDARQHTPVHPSGPGPAPAMQTRPMANGHEEASRPVVRLPSTAPSTHSVQQEAQPTSSQPPPAQQPLQQQPQQPPQQPPKAPTPRTLPQQPPPSYTPSMNPAPYREHRATPKIPMHQPRPQKAVNVSEIDSPAIMHFPQNYGGGAYDPSGNANGYAHSRHPSYPSQTCGTPLSQIPEAVHARPFQPQPYPVPQGYYAHPPPHAYPPPHQMHHPPPMQHGFQPPPPYVPSGPSPMPNGMTAHYAVPVPVPQQQQGPPQPAPAPVPSSAAPPGQPAGPTTVAHESNGMVYYSTYDPATQYQQYPPAAAYSNTPGSMPITPAPDGNGAVYGAPAGPMPVQGPVYYYPAATPGYYGA